MVVAETAGIPVTRRQLRAAERAAPSGTPEWQFPAGGDRPAADDRPTEKIASQPFPTRRELRSRRASSKARGARRGAVPRGVILAALGVVTVAVPVLGLDGTDHSAHGHTLFHVTGTATSTAGTEGDAGAATLDYLPLTGPQAVAAEARPETDLPSRAQERTPLETPPAPAQTTTPPVEAAPEPAPTVVMPLAAGTYRQTSPYGERTDPITGGPGFHTGVDFAAPLDSPIYAVADGVVDYVGPSKDGRSSMIIVLRHTINGQDVYTWYNHMYARGLYVEEGQTVTAGQVIAGVGNNGRSTGPHLHFEVHTDDDLTTTDPLAWLAQQGAVDASLLPTG